MYSIKTIRKETKMKERKIGFGKINEYGDEVSLLLKEYTIQKIEKTQEIIEQRYSNGAIASSSASTETAVFLDNNECFTLVGNIKLLEGWHVRETYIVIGRNEYLHSSVCPEAKMTLFGTDEYIDGKFKFLRWYETYYNQIIKVCNKNEEKYAVELENEIHRQQLSAIQGKDINKVQSLRKQYGFNYLSVPRGRATWWPSRNLTAHLRFRFLWIMFIITTFLVWVAEGYFIPKSYFSFKWLFIAVGISLLLNIGAVQIFNSPRKKAFKKLMEAKAKMPDFCNKILDDMNSIYSRFTKEGIDAIPETELQK